MDRKVHLISFDVPFPPDYGGAIDVYYKIAALKAIGIQVILHCFDYGRGRADSLRFLCDEVHYYPRKSFWRNIFSGVPYIVASRNHPLLFERVTADPYPILFEGLHTCFFLPHPKWEQKKKVMRMHNIEWHYYSQLAKVEANIFKKAYYSAESYLLKKYEPIVKFADTLCAISVSEQAYFSGKTSHCVLLPAFHSYEKIETEVGIGRFLLYHGNLSVAENEQAVKLLLEKVMPHLPDMELVIAGKRPSAKLVEWVKHAKNIRLVSDPNETQLCQLIQEAHVHLLPALQNTGVKLKLLHALFKGRYCLGNTAMVGGSMVEELCLVEDDLEKWPLLIRSLSTEPFPMEEVDRRKRVLGQYYDNRANAHQLEKILFDDGRNGKISRPD